MTTRWDWFTRFLESSAIPIHNNDSERAVKFPILGRNAWLFFGCPQGGETAAIMYTLTATCRRLHMNHEHYLTDLCHRIPLCNPQDLSTYEPLLPNRWLEEHPQAKLNYREQEAIQRATRKREQRSEHRHADTAAAVS
jgi:hypothetical protein